MSRISLAIHILASTMILCGTYDAIAIETSSGEAQKIETPAEAAALVQRAQDQLRAQELESAFRDYLRAVEYRPTATCAPLAEDERLYAEALELYLANPGRAAKDTARCLNESYANIVNQHPDYHLLGYIVALSSANLGQFAEFFSLFYTSYQACPDHFLADKTKALLHMKLLERARDEKTRVAEKAQIWRHLDNAVTKNPSDSGLYQMYIAFAPADKKSQAVRTSLNNIISQNIMVPRGDLLFFVKEAVDAGERDLALSFMVKARSWYPQSRQLAAAEAYLISSNRS